MKNELTIDAVGALRAGWNPLYGETEIRDESRIAQLIEDAAPAELPALRRILAITICLAITLGEALTASQPILGANPTASSAVCAMGSACAPWRSGANQSGPMDPRLSRGGPTLPCAVHRPFSFPAPVWDVRAGMASGCGVIAAAEGRLTYTIASWYGDECAGRLMANGQPFSPGAMTCASWDYPPGTRLRVAHGARTVVVRVTDRGPAMRLVRDGRRLDLSREAFRRLAPLGCGIIRVTIHK